MPYATVPPSIVGNLLEQTVVSRDDLNAIRDPRSPSRFCGVYEHVHGGRYTVTSYRARVFKFFELGSGFDSKEEAARAIVAIYKSQFGEPWARAFRYRKVTPWRLLPIQRESGVFYAVDIYYRGRPQGITHADAGGVSPSWLWPTPESAKRAAHEALRLKFESEKHRLIIPARGLLFWRL
jgi:hypothetical protein